MTEATEHAHMLVRSIPGGSDSKRICLQFRRPRFDPWVGKIPWRREWLPTPAFFPGEFHGQRSLVGYSPWGCKELDTIEGLTLPIFLYSKKTTQLFFTQKKNYEKI